tara:strand:+ start:6796 stop:7110 length:315 start_codon:yes stop_codon:yes gene_type:complete
MPQVIFSSRIKTLPFPTFLLDFKDEDKHLFTWNTIFNTIHQRYGINLNVLRLFDQHNKAIDYKDIPNKPAFNINNFIMRTTDGKQIGDFWINFDIYPRKGETLY